MLNAEQIKFVEAAPDTIITLIVGDEKFMVKESVAEVVEKAIDYKRQWFIGLSQSPSGMASVS